MAAEKTDNTVKWIIGGVLGVLFLGIVFMFMRPAPVAKQPAAGGKKPAAGAPAPTVDSTLDDVSSLIGIFTTQKKQPDAAVAAANTNPLAAPAADNLPTFDDTDGPAA